MDLERSQLLRALAEKHTDGRKFEAEALAVGLPPELVARHLATIYCLRPTETRSI